MKERLTHYLTKLIEHNGSDLHVSAASGVYMRIYSELHLVGKNKLTNEEMIGIANEILTPSQYEQLVEAKEFDCSYVLEDNSRFRVNFFYQVDGLSAVMRAIPTTIFSFDELHLPDVLKELADLNHGLVLVTGVTGSGKTTTLATMIDRINTNKRRHIITIEDPIEYLHEDKKSLVSQRAIGINSHSFGNALRAALREDIDVISVGELRDLETVEMALRAASTGHLVFSTLHTHDSKESISRIIGMFPKEEQDRVRTTLSFVLEGVISQRLVEAVDGGRIVAIEVMKRTSRIAELIADNRDNEILETIISGKEIYGSQSFDQSLLDLYTQGRISKEEALKNATTASDMKLTMAAIKKGSGDQNLSQKEKVPENFFDLKSQDKEV
jgi:twitching motility protein PilT